MSPDVFGNGQQHAAGIAVKAFRAVIITNIGNNLTYQFVEIHMSIGGDFTQQHDKPVLSRFRRLHGTWILRKAGIQNGITDLIANLVGMPLGYRF